MRPALPRLVQVQVVALLLSLAASSPARADEADARYREGLAAMQQGKLDAAEAALHEALRLRPGHVAAELTLANVLRKRKQCAEAVPHYEAVLRAQPKDPFANGNYGFCLVMTGRHEEAIRSLETAVENAPAELQWRTSLAATYRAVKQHDKALPHLEKAVELDPKNADLSRNLVLGLRLAKQPERALAILDRLVGQAPSDVSLRLEQAAVYRVLNRKPEAIAALREVVRLDGRNAEAWYDLGVLHAAQQQKPEAIEALNRYIDLVALQKPTQAEGARQQIKGLGGTPH